MAKRLRKPAHLAREVLLRSYRPDEWARWFAAAGVPCPLVRGAVFDSSLTLAEAAVQGVGVALLPARMFAREIESGRLLCPFDIEIETGSYWLTRLKSKRVTPAMRVFREWVVSVVQ